MCQEGNLGGESALGTVETDTVTNWNPNNRHVVVANRYNQRGAVRIDLWSGTETRRRRNRVAGINKIVRNILWKPLDRFILVCYNKIIQKERKWFQMFHYYYLNDDPFNKNNNRNLQNTPRRLQLRWLCTRHFLLVLSPQSWRWTECWLGLWLQLRHAGRSMD